METVGTHNHSRVRALEFLGGGSLAESVAGAGAMVLAILALTGIEGLRIISGGKLTSFFQ